MQVKFFKHSSRSKAQESLKYLISYNVRIFRASRHKQMHSLQERAVYKSACIAEVRHQGFHKPLSQDIAERNTYIVHARQRLNDSPSSERARAGSEIALALRWLINGGIHSKSTPSCPRALEFGCAPAAVAYTPHRSTPYIRPTCTACAPPIRYGGDYSATVSEIEESPTRDVDFRVGAVVYIANITLLPIHIVWYSAAIVELLWSIV